MRPINPKLKTDIERDPYYQQCARKKVFDDHQCAGRITMEHALIYGGKQVDEKFAIIPICELAHSVGIYQDFPKEKGGLDKHKNEYIALSRATSSDFKHYYKADWERRFELLRKRYQWQDRTICKPITSQHTYDILVQMVENGKILVGDARMAGALDQLKALDYTFFDGAWFPTTLATSSMEILAEAGKTHMDLQS